MPRVDFQIQTTFSDGRNTPEQIAHMVKDVGLLSYAVTDHDTVLGIEPSLIAAKHEGVVCIPGVELSVNVHGKLNHLLGLGIDHQNEELLFVIARQMEARKIACIDALPLINQRLRAEQCREINQSEFENEPDTTYSLPGLMQYLTRNNLVPDSTVAPKFVSGVLAYNFPLNVGEAVEAIHRAGGIASLSHPLAPRISLKSLSSERTRHIELLEELRSDGVDALEISSSGHTEKENQFLRDIAMKEDYMLTFGTDWHGTLGETGVSIRNYLPYYDGVFSGIEISDKENEILAKVLKYG